MKRRAIIILIAMMGAAIHAGCGPREPQPITVGLVKDGELDPEAWGAVYPLQYESWLKTKEPKPAGKSRYKRGWDTDRIVYDKLSEYPYAALLYNGWGFGIEYNEPRGHFYAVRDQIEIDTSRVKPGGVCLACKSPYHRPLIEKHGMKYLTATFADALKMIPQKTRELGPSCADCHRNRDMGLRFNKDHLARGLAMIGKKDPSRQELRLLACAQCHITYYVPRDRGKKVAGDVSLPWAGSSWGDISIENIIRDLLKDFRRIEWRQKVTGLDLPFIRHPEFELFTRQSVHFRAGVACADCHMPYRRTGSYKISDHDVTSPLKTDLRACAQCHTESAVWLRGQVYATQDRTASLLSRAGYATATAAKLIERANAIRGGGKAIDAALVQRAKDLYVQAFLRLVFASAENSLGFHNPPETGRVLGDSIAYASRAQALLRQALAGAGAAAPEPLGLELGRYLKGRGEKKLGFTRGQELRDPFDVEKNFTPESARGY